MSAFGVTPDMAFAPADLSCLSTRQVGHSVSCAVVGCSPLLLNVAGKTPALVARGGSDQGLEETDQPVRRLMIGSRGLSVNGAVIVVVRLR